MHPSRLPVLIALFLVAAAPAAMPVALTAQPGTKLDATARTLAARDLAEAAAAGDAPLVLVATVDLGPRQTPLALFLQLQSARECGSAGCGLVGYLRDGTGWRKILDAAAGSLALAPTRHGGMRDLLIDGHDRWIWTGRVYADTEATPAISLRPRGAARK